MSTNDNKTMQTLVSEAMSFVRELHDASKTEEFRSIVRECGIANLTFNDPSRQILQRHDLLKHHKSLLHFAVFSGRPLAVAVLLEEGANPNTKNNSGLTPLDLARNFLNSEKQLRSLENLVLEKNAPTIEDLQKIVDMLQCSSTSVQQSSGKRETRGWFSNLFGGKSITDQTTIDAVIQEFRKVARVGNREKFPRLKAQLTKFGDPAMRQLLTAAMDNDEDSSFRKSAIHFLIVEAKFKVSIDLLFRRYVKGKDPQWLYANDPQAFGLFNEVTSDMEQIGYSF